MGRRSKSEKAIEKIIKIKREPGFFTVVIKKGDTIVFNTKRISKIDLIMLDDDPLMSVIQ